jgi:lipid-A-disaccharide synthase-like uncharacterized protein
MRDPLETIRARVAWRGAALAALLNGVGWPLELLIARGLPGMVLWPAVTASLTGFALLALLLALRRRAGVRLASWAFLFNTAVIVAMLWEMHAHYAHLAPSWAPFQENKLGALTVALLTPELWVGALSIAAFGGSAVLQWLLFDDAVRHRLPAGEPWATLAFSVFGAILLVYAVRRRSLEQRMLLAESQSAALARLARSYLAIRDFTNTPLQTIQSTTDLVRARHPELAETLEPVQRSLQRMKKLNDVLARHEARADWSVADISLDPLALLRENDEVSERGRGPAR